MPPPFRMTALTALHTPYSLGPLKPLHIPAWNIPFANLGMPFMALPRRCVCFIPPLALCSLLHYSTLILLSFFSKPPVFFTRTLLEDRCVIYSLLYSIGPETMPDINVCRINKWVLKFL